MQGKSAADAAAAASLKKELAARPTMSEMRSLKQQLRVLQQLEYNADEDVRCCCCLVIVVAWVHCVWGCFFRTHYSTGPLIKNSCFG